MRYPSSRPDETANGLAKSSLAIGESETFMQFVDISGGFENDPYPFPPVASKISNPEARQRDSSGPLVSTEMSVPSRKDKVKIGLSSSSSIACFSDMLEDSSNSFSLEDKQKKSEIFQNNSRTACGDGSSDVDSNNTNDKVIEKNQINITHEINQLKIDSFITKCKNKQKKIIIYDYSCKINKHAPFQRYDILTPVKNEKYLRSNKQGTSYLQANFGSVLTEILVNLYKTRPTYSGLHIAYKLMKYKHNNTTDIKIKENI